MAIVKTKDIISADAFLRIAVRLLKYLISRGRVTIPTAISEETNAAICTYPAPASRRAEPNGKATKPGINEIDPAVSERITPEKPDSEPMSFEIVSGLRIASVIPANIITEKISGRRPEKDFQALRRAISVFFLSLK
jgi:hypothetical protein